MWVGKAIALIGAGPDVSIVDPSLGPGGRCLTLNDVRRGGRVEGFTCQNGAALEASSPNGGGMLIQGGRPKLKRVVFRRNTASVNGGGVWIDGGDVTVHDASFLINDAAISVSGGMDPTRAQLSNRRIGIFPLARPAASARRACAASRRCGWRR